ncbi:MAG TPA: UDP-N-acetylmuramate dehydrogenase [Bacteroidia bacterium]|jgi:UDP-N-acetylmuramate dehydrogenase|nr:UDP-N-acetylmuramate dehydrogenase [Bacteroidia bacterium]
MNITPHHSLRTLNTFGIDATARFFATGSSIAEMQELLNYAAHNHLTNLILGGGSNVLFRTPEINALVIKNNLTGITLLDEDTNHVYIRSGAGENWHGLVMYCIAHNYGGIENLSLIPGNAGAGPMQNIGAYGAELKDVFHELEAMRIADGVLETFDKTRCRFGYRESIFKQEARNQYIITTLTLKLYKKPEFRIQYGALRQELDKRGVKELTLAAVSEAVCAIRRSKLPDPAITGNAGSFFKNPEIDASLAGTLKKAFPEMVSYSLENGRVKLAAGWLIEACGWKGKTLGRAGVHPLQALVLVNTGQATGNEIYELSSRILESVQQKFGVTLEREVNMIG